MGDLNVISYSGIVAFPPRFTERENGAGTVVFYVRSEHVYSGGRNGSVHTTMMRIEFHFRDDSSEARRIAEGVYCVVSGNLRNIRWSNEEGQVFRQVIIMARELKVTQRHREDDDGPKGLSLPEDWD